jgi:hypothetical protein
MSKYLEIKSIYERAQRIVASDLEWDKKYDMIFSEEVSRKVSFDWNDPDCGYEDDVRAFMEGFDRYMRDSKIVYEQIDRE